MPKYAVTFQREFEVEVQADNLETAQMLAKQVMAQFPSGSCKLLSIIVEGYVEKPCDACEAGEIVKPQPPPGSGSPLGGGSPGSTTATVPVLVDQIADAA